MSSASTNSAVAVVRPRLPRFEDLARDPELRHRPKSHVDEPCGADRGLDVDCDEVPWVEDQDGDGHGVRELAVACEPPPGAAPAGGDCQDLDRWVHPGAAEVCNGVDDDCDNLIDEGFNIGSACDGADTDLCPEGEIICTSETTTGCDDPVGENDRVSVGATELDTVRNPDGRPPRVVSDVSSRPWLIVVVWVAEPSSAAT